MNQAGKSPELSSADRHALAELIVEQDGISYELALEQIEVLTKDLEDPGFLAAALLPSMPAETDPSAAF